VPDHRRYVRHTDTAPAPDTPEARAESAVPDTDVDATSRRISSTYAQFDRIETEAPGQLVHGALQREDPVTNEGRLFGSLIIVIGVGIFGTFTGYLANPFQDARHHASAISSDRRPVQGQRAQGLMAQQQAQQQAAMDDIDCLLQSDAT